MSIYNQNIYENIRTRVIVLHQGCMLVIPPGKSAPEAVWSLPGGGLHPHETLAECACREVLEETGIPVLVGHIAFLREWVVPRHVHSTDADPDGRGYGYGLEVFHYATPQEPVPEPRPEQPGAPAPKWVPLIKLPTLPLWPKELKLLAQRLLRGQAPDGTVSILGQLEGPLAKAERSFRIAGRR